ncbi:DUF262 domain-containing protein [Cryobacterium sp. GrIS_2_6]|uniref:DUF262 domain-containing protein n=1 Tax=Cryobacterium sp. GrIS_2_6 TaxID=3162785 RepID=UPI002E0A291F|nr:uncharacterized protein with ParB-like and HNH nuclease domain [Cryobacterium psychrotolerans]
MSQQIQIKTLIGRVLHGEVRIPGFQRDFVWEPQRAALLMDSIYKEYPFGTILLWRSRTALKTEKKLGSFVLPDPEDEYWPGCWPKLMRWARSIGRCPWTRQ